MQDLIFKLCSSVGVSGNENNITDIVTNELIKYSSVKVDKFGSIIATMGNPNAKKNIMLDAHIDQIGLIVTFIDDRGFVKVAPCGGVDRRVMPGSTIKTVCGDEIYGIVCCTPPHLSDGEKDKVEAVDEIYIDFGMPKDDISKVIKIGDYLALHTEPKMLLNNKICARALDNRAGVAALIRCAQILYNKNLDCKVTILLSAQEETGAVGAKTSAYKINPDESIIVDVSFASQPFLAKEKCGRLSKGPMIGIAPPLSNEITNTLISIAKEKDISYQLEVMGSGTGTNADSITTTRQGVKTGLVSIPQRYMHTPVEVVDIKDIEATAKLISEYVVKGGLKNG